VNFKYFGRPNSSSIVEESSLLSSEINEYAFNTQTLDGGLSTLERTSSPVIKKSPSPFASIVTTFLTEDQTEISKLPRMLSSSKSICPWCRIVFTVNYECYTN
jgi:hypothetical protein